MSTLRDDLNEAADLIEHAGIITGKLSGIEAARIIAARLRSHAEADHEGRLRMAVELLKRIDNYPQSQWAKGSWVSDVVAFLAEESKRTLGTP